MPRFVPFLQEGISLNSWSANTVEAKALRWGNVEDLESLSSYPDLILVSDCIYYEASVEPLISTLKALSHQNPECVILLSYEVRDYLESKQKIAKEFFRAVGQHFRIVPKSTDECHEDYASDDIRVIQLVFQCKNAE